MAANYIFECNCGECFKTAEAAMRCRKCRYYAPDELRKARNLETGEVLTFNDVFPPPPPLTPAERSEMDDIIAATYAAWEAR